MASQLIRTMPLEDEVEREIAIVISRLRESTSALQQAIETERQSIRRMVALQEVYEQLYGVEATLPADTAVVLSQTDVVLDLR